MLLPLQEAGVSKVYGCYWTHGEMKIGVFIDPDISKDILPFSTSSAMNGAVQGQQ